MVLALARVSRQILPLWLFLFGLVKCLSLLFRDNAFLYFSRFPLLFLVISFILRFPLYADDPCSSQSEAKLLQQRGDSAPSGHPGSQISSLCSFTTANVLSLFVPSAVAQ